MEEKLLFFSFLSIFVGYMETDVECYNCVKKTVIRSDAAQYKPKHNKNRILISIDVSKELDDSKYLRFIKFSVTYQKIRA